MKDFEGARKWLTDFLNENFESGKATVKVSEDKITYYVNGQWIFEQDRKNNTFWVHHYSCWEIFYKQFNLKYEQVKELMRKEVLNPFNCEGYTPKLHFHDFTFLVLNPFNCEGYTPSTSSLPTCFRC